MVIPKELILLIRAYTDSKNVYKKIARCEQIYIDIARRIKIRTSILGLVALAIRV